MPVISLDSKTSMKGSIDDYEIGKEIGKGAYALVKVATHKATRERFAVKIYEKFRLMDSLKKTAVSREIAVMKKLNHPNIVKMHEVIETSKHVYLIK
jgi:serine/threonine protein kinase